MGIGEADFGSVYPSYVYIIDVVGKNK